MKKEFIFILVFIFLSSLILGAPTSAPPSTVGDLQGNLNEDIQEEQILEDNIEEISKDVLDTVSKLEQTSNEAELNIDSNKETDFNKKRIPMTTKNFIDKLEHFSTSNQEVFNPLGEVFLFLDVVLGFVVFYLIYKRIKNRKKSN